MNPQRLPILHLLIAVALTSHVANAETRSFNLKDCIQQAIQQNLGLRVARYEPLFAQNNLSLAYAGYDPTLNISGDHSYRRTGDYRNADQQFVLPYEAKSDSFSADLGGLLPWGMTYDLIGRAEDTSGKQFLTNNLFVPIDNSQGAVEVRITQPILKNAWIDGTRLNITVAKQQLASSKEVYRQTLIDLVTTVEDAYYDLASARENLKVQEKALQLAKELLADNRKRVEIGAMAPLDVKQAQAEVAAREADLLSAQQVLDLRENALKRAISDDYAQWNKVQIVPSDELSAPTQLFDLQDSWDKGLTMRPDIIQAWLTMEQRDIELKYSKNQLFPQLDVVASYGHSGTSVEFSGLFTQYEQGTQPFWSAGAVFSIPISNTEARARHRNARARVEQSVLAMKDLEQTVMAEIDDAIKLAQVGYRRVDATRVAREYAEAALEAEQEKLASGKSTSFEVLQLQRDLTTARSSEIDALTQYNKALAALAQREGTTLQRRQISLESE